VLLRRIKELESNQRIIPDGIDTSTFGAPMSIKSEKSKKKNTEN
jgi:hypothetical protein